MAGDEDEDARIERDLKRLQRDRLAEELRQMRGRTLAQWITPATLLALVPLASGFGLYIWGEVRAFTALHRENAALRDENARARDILARNAALQAELDALETRRSTLNVEIAALLGQSAHWRDEARDLEARFLAREADLVRAWTTAALASGEMRYALSHLGGLPDIAEARASLLAGTVGTDLAGPARALAERTELQDMIGGIAVRIAAGLDTALATLPVPARIARLTYQPDTLPLMGPGLLVWPAGDPREVYDVPLGRFLEPAEIAARQR